jgi:hypothetical protein
MALAAVAIATTVCLSGCSPKYAQPEGSDPQSSLEAQCGWSFAELDSMIDSRATEPHFPKERLVEARELRAAAFGLYVDGHYQPALDLIDEAISLLRTKP